MNCKPVTEASQKNVCYSFYGDNYVTGYQTKITDNRNRICAPYRRCERRICPRCQERRVRERYEKPITGVFGEVEKRFDPKLIKIFHVVFTCPIEQKGRETPQVILKAYQNTRKWLTRAKVLVGDLRSLSVTEKGRWHIHSLLLLGGRKVPSARFLQEVWRYYLFREAQQRGLKIQNNFALVHMSRECQSMEELTRALHYSTVGQLRKLKEAMSWPELLAFEEITRDLRLVDLAGCFRFYRKRMDRVFELLLLLNSCFGAVERNFLDGKAKASRAEAGLTTGVRGRDPPLSFYLAPELGEEKGFGKRDSEFQQVWIPLLSKFSPGGLESRSSLLQFAVDELHHRRELNGVDRDARESISKSDYFFHSKPRFDYGASVEDITKFFYRFPLLPLEHPDFFYVTGDFLGDVNDKKDSNEYRDTHVSYCL